MEQKKFMDISRIKEDTQLTESNTRGFEVGDLIVVQEKVDGSNSAMAYDVETDKLVAFSRKYELSYDMTLKGFWNWVQTLDVEAFRKYPDYVFFGEWLSKHKIKYLPEAYNKFYFYDVYDKKNQCYLLQSEVKRLSEELGLIYVKTYYVGEFISWEHCKSFMKSSDIAIGEPEGVVIKNQSKLNNPYSRTPFVLKIVNEKFSEVIKKQPKEVNPEKEAARTQAAEIVESIVTRSRVEKEIYKMRDEGILPEKIDPSDMKLVAKNLPKRIYDDCVKEENELVIAAGEYFGKMCGSVTMIHARNIILGDMS
jgi:hypothetical protein